MSSYCSVDAALKNLHAYDAKLTLDSFIVKASSKAFVKVFKMSALDVNIVQKDGVHVIKSSEKLQTSQIKGAEQTIKARSFASDVPAALLEVQSLPNAVEALPITNPNSLMTLHYT